MNNSKRKLAPDVLINICRVGDINLFNEVVQKTFTSHPHKKTVMQFYQAVIAMDPKSQGQTPLHLASAEGHYALIKALITTIDKNYNTYNSFLSGNGQDLKEFKSQIVNSKDKSGWTPLHCAASNSHFKIVKYLLKQDGTDPTIVTLFGKSTALHYLVKKRERKIVDPEPSLKIEKQEAAVLINKIIEIMVSKGVNVNSPNSSNETPLHLACFAGNEVIVKTLLENPKFKTDINILTLRRETCLHYAVRNRNTEVVNILIEHGADPSVVSESGTIDDIVKQQQHVVKQPDSLSSSPSTSNTMDGSSSLSGKTTTNNNSGGSSSNNNSNNNNNNVLTNAPTTNVLVPTKSEMQLLAAIKNRKYALRDIPDDVLHNILLVVINISANSARELFRISQINTFFRRHAYDARLWRHITVKDNIRVTNDSTRTKKEFPKLNKYLLAVMEDWRKQKIEDNERRTTLKQERAFMRQNISAETLKTMVSTEPGVDFLFNLHLIGDPSIGKTSLILRFSDEAGYISSTSSPDFKPELGMVDFKIKQIVFDKTRVRLKVFDHTKRSHESWRKGSCHGVVFMYSVKENERESLSHVKKWLGEFEKYSVVTGGLCYKFLIANKCDGEEGEKEGIGGGREVAGRYNMGFFETSVKEGKGVKEAFEGIGRVLVKELKDIQAERGKTWLDEDKRLEPPMIYTGAPEQKERCVVC